MESPLDWILDTWWMARGKEAYREKALRLLETDGVYELFNGSKEKEAIRRFVFACAERYGVEDEVAFLAYVSMLDGYEPLERLGTPVEILRVPVGRWSESKD